MRKITFGFVALILAVGLASAALLATRKQSDTKVIAGVPERVLRMHSVSLTMRSSLRALTGTTRYTDSSAQLDFAHDRSFVDLPDVVRSNTLTLVSQGLTLYVSVPRDLEATFPDARWLRVDTGSRAEARGARVSAIPDPATVMLALAGATGDPRQLGRRQLDGVSTRVVRVRIKPVLMAARLGADSVASANVLGGINLTWSADVWLDSDDLPVRVELKTNVTEHDKAAGSLAFDLRLGAYNEPVRIGIPPASAIRKVATVQEAMSTLGAQ